LIIIACPAVVDEVVQPGVAVAVRVGVTVAEPVGVAVPVEVEVLVEVDVAVAVSVGVSVLVSVGVACLIGAAWTDNNRGPTSPAKRPANRAYNNRLRAS
jgi:hypothetical protein